jgi:hypothetical protein
LSEGDIFASIYENKGKLISDIEYDSRNFMYGRNTRLYFNNVYIADRESINIKIAG